MGVTGIGRRQKPEALRALHGSRRRPHHHPQPRPVADEPTPPEDLGVDGRAKWEELAALMRGERRLSASDGAWLEAVARAWQDYAGWAREQTKAPLTVGHGDDVKVHPAHQQARLALRAFTDLLKDGGFTPASRARVSVPQPTEVIDPAEVFLRRVQ